MIVYELRVDMILKDSIPYYEAGEKVGQLLNQTLCKDPKYLIFHEESKDYKFYVYDSFSPFESDGIYREKKRYRIRLRTVKADLADYFLESLSGENTKHMECIGVDIKVIPQKFIEEIYTLTPVILKNYPEGYWKDNLSVAQFEKRLFENLVKKYRTLTGKTMEEDFLLYNKIEFINKKPIKVTYKGITLLGDKLRIIPAQNKSAQDLFYMALGTGLLENNSNGCGFIKYIWG